MLHDVYQMSDASTCDFEDETAEDVVAVEGTEACEFTAGDESSCTSSGKCLYDATADTCSSKPRWRTATLGPFDAVGTHFASCSVGSADWCTATGGSFCPVGELQAWAHCAVFAQKLTINVVVPDEVAKASAAQASGVLFASLASAATLLWAA